MGGTFNIKYLVHVNFVWKINFGYFHWIYHWGKVLLVSFDKSVCWNRKTWDIHSVYSTLDIHTVYSTSWREKKCEDRIYRIWLTGDRGESKVE